MPKPGRYAPPSSPMTLGHGPGNDQATWITMAVATMTMVHAWLGMARYGPVWIERITANSRPDYTETSLAQPPNYRQQKKQRELVKKKKNEQKRQRKEKPPTETEQERSV